MHQTLAKEITSTLSAVAANHLILLSLAIKITLMELPIASQKPLIQAVFRGKKFSRLLLFHTFGHNLPPTQIAHFPSRA